MTMPWWHYMSEREKSKRIQACADIRDVVKDWADGSMQAHDCMKEIYEYMCQHGLIRRPK